MEDIRITADMIYDAGPLEMMLFSAAHPDGMLLSEMQKSEEAWIQRAAARYVARVTADEHD